MAISRGDGMVRPNCALVGSRNSRIHLDTPALILDLDALERNIERMAEWAKKVGIGLRPHLKTHKCSQIGRLQLAAGARGFCCATIGEAEVMVSAGLSNILITSPLVTDAKIERALLLLAQDPGLCLVVDNRLNADRISELAGRSGQTVDVLVDIDPGMHRTGVADMRTAIELVGWIVSLKALRFGGLQCYAGHVQHMSGLDARQEATLSVLGSLRVLSEELKARGLEPAVVSGGGTGTHSIDGQAGVLTELQVGSYALMDAQYNQVWTADGRPPPFEVALFVQSSVISNNHTGYATCDAGLKHFAVDGGKPAVARGAAPEATYVYGGDCHGLVTGGPGAPALELGDRIEFVVPHCDPTVNLYDAYHCVRGDELVDIWPINARGV